MKQKTKYSVELIFSFIFLSIFISFTTYTSYLFIKDFSFNIQHSISLIVISLIVIFSVFNTVKEILDIIKFFLKLKTICPDCGHSLINNKHGPDQNDYEYDVKKDTIVYMGTCTYCKECHK